MEFKSLGSLNLNSAQLKAVQHPPSVPLQILAGPGSGKTKVLTSRIAHLILDHNLEPSSICAVTFTNKAANEMRERLTKLIGKQKTDELKMGTFHSLCALFLRKYAHVLGLEANFSICDADQSKKIISSLLKPYKDFLATRKIILTEGTVSSHISKAKARGSSPDDLFMPKKPRTTAKQTPKELQKPLGEMERIVVKIYQDYEDALRRSNSLDFDDLLVFGVQLFRAHAKAVRWCRHVLVDEFQDTNVMQYELMQLIASSSGCVTVVGDPDQSIYGWRSAEVGNLAKMCEDFPATQQILLEENYRSTASILSASLAIVAQDKLRIPKTLHATHPRGVAPFLGSFSSEHEEAKFIATEIKRLVANMGGTLKWGDFVVLLRFTALSRPIESALQKEGIPSRILGGRKFFERMEVKDILAYLQLIDNPDFVPAFIHAVNVPSRGIGEKTLSELTTRAGLLNLSPLAVVEQIHDAKIPDTKPGVKRKLAAFVKIVRQLRDLASAGALPADIIRTLLDLTDYHSHLRRTEEDWENRWENVQELINFASDFDSDTGTTDALALASPTSQPKSTPLRLFLQESMLSSAGDKESGDASAGKVTIATCHAAKGLEWPVVVVPAVEQGTFPFYRSDDIEEERRLLYVACTRAQGLLYLTHSAKRKVAGETKNKELSEFIHSAASHDNSNIFSDRISAFGPNERAVLSKVLGRAAPEPSEVTRRVAEFNDTAKYRDHISGMSASFRPTWNTEPSHDAPSTFSTTIGTAASVYSAISSSSVHRRADSLQTPAAQPKISATGSVPPRPAPRLHPLCAVQPNLQTNASVGPATSRPAPVVPRPGASVPPRPAAGVGLSQNENPNPPVKRRLGMGRGGEGYSNKKFRPPS